MKVKGLNDSLYIAAIIYITSILWVAIILVSVLLNNSVNTYSVLLATIIFISASVILGLVFVPKVTHVLHHTIICILCYRWCGSTKIQMGKVFSVLLRMVNSSSHPLFSLTSPAILSIVSCQTSLPLTVQRLSY